MWKRHDLPGHEACRVLPIDTGWQIADTATLASDGQACRLDYVIDCDPQWLTRSAAVSGWMDRREVDVKVVRNEYGQWLLNARECDQVAGCTDIDLNFSPSTNLLPIRRLNLQVGEAAQVRAASPLITFLPPTGVYLFSRAIPEIVDCSSFSDISRTYIKSAAA